MRFLVFFTLSIALSLSHANAIEIDVKSLEQEIADKPYDLNTRLVIARSYISVSDFDKAEALLDQVLEQDMADNNARTLIKEIKKLRQLTDLMGVKQLSNNKSVTQYIEKLYSRGQYEYIGLIYGVLNQNNIALEKDVARMVVLSLLKQKQIDKAKTVLKDMKMPLDEKHLLMARIAEFEGAFDQSKSHYVMAFHKNQEAETLCALYSMYLKTGNQASAQQLVASYAHNGKDDPVYKALLAQEDALKDAKLDAYKVRFEKEMSLDALEQYFYALEERGHKRVGLLACETYIAKEPQDEAARLFAAKQWYWTQNLNKPLSLLTPIIDKTQNSEILNLYAEIALQLGLIERAKVAMARLEKIDPNQSALTQQLIKAQNDAILQKAVIAHRQKIYDEAITHYKTYFFNTKDPKIAKEIAELLYVQEAYEDASAYFETYLLKYPKDNRARFRYAACLEKLKSYDRAETAYAQIAQSEDSINQLAAYRYANALILQEEDTKWNESRAVLKSLIAKLYAQTPSKERDNLLKHSKAMFEKVSKPMPKPKQYKDIMLTEAQDKILKPEEIFNKAEFAQKPVADVKSMLMPIDTSAKPQKRKDITLTMHHLEDDIIKNIAYGVRLNNIAKVGDGALSVEAKRSRYKTGHLKESANSFIGHYHINDIAIALGVTQFEDFSDLLAKLTYRKSLAGHDLTMGLGYQNGAFVNNRARMIKERIGVIQLSLYDAILLSNLEQAQVSVQFNAYEDENMNVNSWIDYPIYTFKRDVLETVFALSGSYEYNTKPETATYLTEFYDGTYLQARPKLYLGKYGTLQLIGGVGYSFENEDMLYTYGLLAELSMYRLFDIRIDCRHYQSGYSPDGADECYATAAYIW